MGVYALPIHACLFAVIYLILRVVGGPAPGSVLLLLLAFWLYFAYGVLINDFFDRELDISQGKSSPKRGHTLTPGEMAVTLVATLAADVAVVYLVGGGPVFDLVWGASILLATLYSAPPVRLRARGAIGFFADSLIEKPLPILAVFAFFGYWGFEAALFPVLGELLDSVFKHQREDLEADEAAGVRSFAVEVGRERSDRAVRELAHPLDAFAVLLLTGVALAEVPGARAGVGLGAALLAAGLLATFALERRGVVREGFPFKDPPVVGFLNFAFRTLILGSMAACLLFADPAYYPVSVLAVLSIAVYLKDYYRLAPDLVRRVAGRGRA